jgi:hypothetical protein
MNVDLSASDFTRRRALGLSPHYHVRSTPLWLYAPNIPFPLMFVARTLLARRVWFGMHGAVTSIRWGSLEVQTLYQINCVTRHLSLPAEYGGLNVPSIAHAR